MTLVKRLNAVEDSLTPLEAMLRWMAEAHAFGSYEGYARWLVDQPDDAYPLIRMPRQVVGALRARHKGVPETRLQSQFYRVQKDLLFLYFLHKAIEVRALLDHESLQLRVIMLLRGIRALAHQRHMLDHVRLDRIDREGNKHPKPGKLEKSLKKDLQSHADRWLPEVQEVTSRILGFLAATDLISQRYFAGQDVLYPDTREGLTSNLETIANLKDMFQDVVLAAPDSDDEFRDYVLGLIRPEEDVGPDGTGKAGVESVPTLPATREARLLARQWVIMAQAEALDELGEHREAEALSAKLISEYL